MNRSGFASILALIFLALFATMAVVYGQAAFTNLASADNQTSALQARLSAESGLSYLSYVLRDTSLSGNPTGQTLLNSVASGLATRLNGTSALAGASISYDGTTIRVPLAATGNGCAFTASITLAPGTTDHLALSATGARGQTSRTVGMNFSVATGTSPVFGYGIASRSEIELTGNASIMGKNVASEANMLSATYSTTEAYTLTGNVAIEGDIYASSPSATVSMTGNTSIGGVKGTNPDVVNHIHLGIGPVAFPEVDPTVFEPFATTIVDSHTSTSGNKTFTNIRIKAGTNPTFSGNITLKGVVFIEQPNSVSFSGNTTLTGVIVTEQAPPNTYTTNKISFTGNMAATGVENLPDTSDFHVLRTMPGSFILAPGFGLKFSGNFGTVGGCMAADSFTFTGNAGGIVRGCVINYSDSKFSLTGNSTITIDRVNTPDTPPGFVLPSVPKPDPDSYYETGGGF